MLSTLSENKNIGLLLGKHPYFRCKTSVLLPKEVRCFATPGPLYLSSPKKVFEKKTYISYTHTSNILLLLAVSDVGLGVGLFSSGVG